jgi:Uma2 family endonuclease
MKKLLEKTDQITLYPDRTWEQFKHIQKGLEGFSSVRLSYYNGTVEILMPGENHEFYKTIIGFLVELFLMNRGIEFIPAGSMTQEKDGTVSVQADESYWIAQKKALQFLRTKPT